MSNYEESNYNFEGFITDSRVIAQTFYEQYTKFPFHVERIADELRGGFNPDEYYLFIIPPDIKPDDFLYQVGKNLRERFIQNAAFEVAEPTETTDEKMKMLPMKTLVENINVKIDLESLIMSNRIVETINITKYLDQLTALVNIKTLEYNSNEFYEMQEILHTISEQINDEKEPRYLFYAKKDTARKSFFLDYYEEWLAISDSLNYSRLMFLYKELKQSKLN